MAVGSLLRSARSYTSAAPCMSAGSLTPRSSDLQPRVMTAPLLWHTQDKLALASTAGRRWAPPGHMPALATYFNTLPNEPTHQSSQTRPVHCTARNPACITLHHPSRLPGTSRSTPLHALTATPACCFAAARSSSGSKVLEACAVCASSLENSALAASRSCRRGGGEWW